MTRLRPSEPKTIVRLSLLFVFGILTSACQFKPVAITLTPTETGQATQALPEPSATASLQMFNLPTATYTTQSAPPSPPQTTSTPDPNLGVGDIIYTDPLDGSSGWDWQSENKTAVFSIAGEQLNAVMTQNGGPQFSFGPAIKVGDQQVRVTAYAQLCYERDEYGFAFRVNVEGQPQTNMYVFKLACNGLARVERLHNRLLDRIVLDWTASPAIVPRAPAENTLMVWMAADQFHFYVNETHLASVRDQAYGAGAYGFYIRDRTTGGESISFFNLVARAVSIP